MIVFAQLFCSTDTWPHDHVRNGNVSSYCETNGTLVFGLNSMYNNKSKVNSRSLLTNIFNLTSNISCESTQMTTLLRIVPTDTISTNSGLSTQPDQSCGANCLKDIETGVIQVVRKICYENGNKYVIIICLFYF